MSRLLLGLLVTFGVAACVTGCSEDPLDPLPSALAVFGWELSGTVSLAADSVVPELRAINRTGGAAIPPIYNDACGVDVRVYGGEGHDVLLFDGIAVHGCLDIAYGVAHGPGEEVRIARPLSIEALVDAGLERSEEYRMVVVLRRFGDLLAVEVPSSTLIELP